MQKPFDSGPAAPVDVAIADVPVAPVAVAFTSEPPAAPAVARRPGGAFPRWRRVAGWGVDLAGIAVVLAMHLLVGARLLRAQSIAELLIAAPSPWLGLGCAVAVIWSWLFVTLWGRTPGMALTGQTLRKLDGGRPGPLAAFARALVAVLSFALGSFGFVLALFDRRTQTLHDKLCGCVVLVD